VPKLEAEVSVEEDIVRNDEEEDKDKINHLALEQEELA